MPKKITTVDVGGLSEFVPVKVDSDKPRVVVTVVYEDHLKMLAMSDKMSKAAGRFVSLGLVVNALIKHYESYE